MPQGGKSQSIDELLQQIERNNKSLQALRQENEAARQEIRSQNNLEDPSVEYSPFYTKGTDGMSSSELVVSQGFDFPTRYAARRKSGRLQSEYLDRQYLVARRDLLLGARLQCLDLIRLNRTRELLEARLRNADELLALFEKRLEEGDASILEVNKIRMERMNATTELAQNESSRQQALAALQAMNGDQAVAFGATEYPEAPAVGGVRPPARRAAGGGTRGAGLGVGRACRRAGGPAQPPELAPVARGRIPPQHGPR